MKSNGLFSSREERLCLTILSMLVAAAAASLIANGYLTSLAKGIWHDEALSIYFSSLTWPELAKLISAYEFNMASYYILLKVWNVLGTSEPLLRSLSLLFFVAATAVTTYSVYLASNLRASLIALVFILGHFYLARYSVEIRGYSLSMLALSLLWLSWYKYFTSRRMGWLATYAVIAMLSAYTHLFASLGVGLLALAGFVYLQRHEIRSWLAVHALAGLAWLPLMIFILSKEQGQLAWVDQPSLRAILDALFMYVGASPQAPPLIRRLLLVGFAVLCLWVTIRFLFLWWRRNPEGAPTEYRPASRAAAFLLLVLGVAPILIVFVLSQFKPVFSIRFFVYYVPFLLASSAILLGSLRIRWSAPVVTALAALHLISSVYYQSRMHENWLEISGHIKQYCQDEQSLGIIFVDPNSQTALPYYLRDSCKKDLFPYRITAESYLNRPELPQLLEMTELYPRVILIDRPSQTVEPLAESYLKQLRADYRDCEEIPHAGGIRVLACVQEPLLACTGETCVDVEKK